MSHHHIKMPPPMPHQPLPKAMEMRRKDETKRALKSKEAKQSEGVYQAIDGDEDTPRQGRGQQKHPDTNFQEEDRPPAQQAPSSRLSNDCVKMLLKIQEQD